MKFYADTGSMATTGEDILWLTKELEEVIQTMFDRINNMPEVTREWFGDSAKEFNKRAQLEKLEYINFINLVRNVGNQLISQADELDFAMLELRR